MQRAVVQPMLGQDEQQCVGQHGSVSMQEKNQRGGALPTMTSVQTESLTQVADPIGATAGESCWHVLWTRSHCEQLVHDQLVAKGYTSFLPKIGRWSRRDGLRYLARVPMFPGYLFLCHPIDKLSYIDVCKSKGLVRILGQRWDRLATIPEREIDSILKVVSADMPAMPHPYLRQGQRVRVIHGPLKSAEGILLKSEPETGQLVLSIDLLHRSIVVPIDCTQVTPL
jgi:transcription antitermination factor NusG